MLSPTLLHAALLDYLPALRLCPGCEVCITICMHLFRFSKAGSHFFGMEKRMQGWVELGLQTLGPEDHQRH